MPNKHQIQKDFYTRRNEWIRKMNNKDQEDEKISIAFDYELDKNGPKSYLINKNEYDFTPKFDREHE